MANVEETRSERKKMYNYNSLLDKSLEVWIKNVKINIKICLSLLYLMWLLQVGRNT